MHKKENSTNTISMKKLLCIYLILFTIMISSSMSPNQIICQKNKTLAKENSAPTYLAIVIDDFGEDRNGVQEMLDINLPLTCAVMPNLTFSIQDANMAHEKGHEVILHMPMESTTKLPRSWYGPTLIYNYDSPEEAIKKVKDGFEKVPFAKGMNFHMGAALPINQKIVDAIVKYTKENDLFFLDSKTDINSIVKNVCKNNQTCLLERDYFLEEHGRKSTAHAIGELNKAITTSKEKGYAIVIGHVGPEGGHTTASAIKSMIPTFEKENVKVVPLSFIYNLNRTNVIA